MNDIIRKILAPRSNLSTLYYGTTSKLWASNTNGPIYLRLTSKIKTAKRFACEAAQMESDQGSIAPEGVVVAFTPLDLSSLLNLGYAFDADPAYLRNPYLHVGFTAEPITARAWQFSLAAYHGVVISGFLHEHKKGLQVMNVFDAVELDSPETVPYPVVSRASCLADLRGEYDNAVTQLTLNAIENRTGARTSLHLTAAINRVNSIGHAIASIEAELKALAGRIAQKIPEESALDDAVLDAFASNAGGLNNQGLQAQVLYLLDRGFGEAEILKEAGVEVSATV